MKQGITVSIAARYNLVFKNLAFSFLPKTYWNKKTSPSKTCRVSHKEKIIYCDCCNMVSICE